MIGLDYKQNNLFTSNFPHEIFTASMHCAPIDSLALQLIGTKTWIFASPEELNKIPAIPMPTSFFLPMTDDEVLSKMSTLHVVKQGPGDALYFGPHWCHAVSTAKGPNLMLNMRYFAKKKIFAGPWELTAKILFRLYISVRGTGLNPQDNHLLYPVIYDDLMHYFQNKCGFSHSFDTLYKKALAMD